MSNEKTIGESVGKAVDKALDKVEIAKDKIAVAKEGIGGIANDISKSVKKAVDDSGKVVTDLIHQKK